MKVIDHLKKKDKVYFSFEIIPPARGKSLKDITDIVELLLPFNPLFIDVTSHSAEANYEELDNGTIKRRIRRKRPGTLGICGIIQHRYNIDAVAHLLCRGFTKEETEDAAIELNYLGIQNVFLLRGDETNFKPVISREKTVNEYASELVKQIHDLRQGKYLEDILNSHPIDFCIGVAGYPEKHFEAPNLKTDVDFLKKKVDAGADYIVTQMFYDNAHFYRFMDHCTRTGIQAPVLPGLKIFNNTAQLKSIPKNFFVNFPDDFVDKVLNHPEQTRELGIELTLKQSKDLISNGFKHLHYYVMNDADMVLEVLRGIG